MSTLGERALECAKGELHVVEDPPGSNTGARVREYLAPCERGDDGRLLNLLASNWCSAFASWCHRGALRPTDKPAHGYRAGVVELVADAASGRYASCWVPVDRVRAGQWEPASGDLAVYDRSVPNRPETSWWRHVNRVSRWCGTSFTAVGGNEGDMVQLSRYQLDRPDLLGFIGYPRELLSAPMLTDAERGQAMALVALTIDGMLRDSFWPR